MRKILVLAAGLMLCALVGQAPAQKKADPTKVKSTVTASSISVNKKLDDKNFSFYLGSTYAGIHVSVPGKFIIGVDATSKVSDFKDDKGNALAEGFTKAQFSTYAQFGKDRSSMITSVYGNKAPASGSSKITLKGDLVLVCGLDEKTTKEKEIENKLNQEETVDGLKIKITNVGGMFGGPSVMITSPKQNIKTIAVTDGDGKELKFYTYGSMYASFTKPVTYSQTFNIEKKADKLKIKVTYFDKEEKVTVPVDASFTLGL